MLSLLLLLLLMLLLLLILLQGADVVGEDVCALGVGLGVVGVEGSSLMLPIMLEFLFSSSFFCMEQPLFFLWQPSPCAHILMDIFILLVLQRPPLLLSRPIFVPFDVAMK